MKTVKTTISIFLTVLLLMALALPMTSAVNTTYAVGDVIQYGTYPQSRVAETAALKSAANNATWKSYDYYTGTYNPTEEELGWGYEFGSSNELNGKMQAGDFMKFADFFLGEKKYRAIIFTDYRPFSTGLQSRATNSYQDENGFVPNTTYYFQYEPIDWIVLDPTDGLIMSKHILDAQAYQNTAYRTSGTNVYQSATSSDIAINYAKSSIRKWLNWDFYQTAFTNAQQSNMKSSEINYTYNDYDNNGSYINIAGTESDKIFLLTFEDVLNDTYGFSNDMFERAPQRMGRGTSYAQCQGLYCFETDSINYLQLNDNSNWWLRNHMGYPYCSSSVPYWGGADASYYFKAITRTCDGVRPACKLKSLSSDTAASETLFSADTSLELPQVEEQQLNFFQRVVQWFRNLFTKLFSIFHR